MFVLDYSAIHFVEVGYVFFVLFIRSKINFNRALVNIFSMKYHLAWKSIATYSEIRQTNTTSYEIKNLLNSSTIFNIKQAHTVTDTDVIVTITWTVRFAFTDFFLTKSYYLNTI